MGDAAEDVALAYLQEHGLQLVQRNYRTPGRRGGEGRMNALDIALSLGVAAVSVAVVLCAWRLLRGPEMTDRLLALDTLYMNAVALIVLLGIRWNTALLFEAALLVAMLGFASTVALARYLSRGDVVE